MTLRAEIITDPDRFLAIRDDWQRLWSDADAYIFQSHAFICGWLSGVQDRKNIKLYVILAWDGDRLCGALPGAIERRTGLRVLSWAAQLFSDYCDCLVTSACDKASVVAFLFDALRHAGGFDLINLQQIRANATCRGYLDQQVNEGSRIQHGDRQERCMRIDNRWKDGEAFFRSLNKKGRNNHTRGKRILAEMGGDVEFRVIASTADGQALIDEVMALKERWLRSNDPASPLLGPDRAVLRSVLDSAWRSGLVKGFLLTCGGKTAAASINFVYANRMEAYFTAYDAAFDRASPGTILIVEYSQWSFDQGLSHVDFLRGEEAFKFRMANAETLLGSYTGARTLIGQAAIAGHRWLSRRRHRQEPLTAGPQPEVEAAG